MRLYFTQLDPPDPGLCEQLALKDWQVCHLALRRSLLLEVDVDLARFDVLIISSKQAARWLKRRELTTWPKLAVVGASSAALLPQQHLLFDQAPANAGELVVRLLPLLGPKTRLLFLRGEKALETIPSGLAHHGLHEHIVYRTEKISKISTPPLQPAMVYFQAPGTVADYLEAFVHPPDYVGAIGPTTARALAGIGWQVHFQPSRPENECFARELPPPAFWCSASNR